MVADDKRLIEDYLPIEAISAEASREKSVRKGHISTLHLWWARRPLVACRAAVYGALVPASRFVPNARSDEKRKSLGRANAAKFVKRLCRYPSDSKPAERADIDRAIMEAQLHVLEAHAERLTRETGKKVFVEDILSGKAPRPKVLDMFAGGGAIPLEALRLGCEAHALDLNPVAYIIELCTLVYPQKYGKPDPTARGMTGPKNAKGETTWGGLADEVRYWGEWVLNKVKAEIGGLYPLIPDPAFKGKRKGVQTDLPDVASAKADDVSPGYLMPVAYLWTRTVTCKNPNCKATVPLVRQTWLCKKPGRYIALKMIAPRGKKQARFEVVEAHSENGLGFDPADFSRRGNATCPFCGTVSDIEYVKTEGWSGRIGRQMLVAVCSASDDKPNRFISPDESQSIFVPEESKLQEAVRNICTQAKVTIPNEQIAGLAPDSTENTLGITVRPYGVRTWGDLFAPRQLAYVLALVASALNANKEMHSINMAAQHCISIRSYLGMLVDRLAGFGNSLCGWNYHEQAVANIFGRHAIPMVWDFAEVSLCANMSGGIKGGLTRIVEAIEFIASAGSPANVTRGSALALGFPDGKFDAVVIDPPYYDNVPYADISDFFYVWLRRTVGDVFPEHFATELTPKKQEIIADARRQGGTKEAARLAYETMMSRAFREAYRVLKVSGQMVIVYAHKTTLGWATLVEALRLGGFNIVEAWPLDTEYSGRLRSQGSSALASSIFLVARKREGAETGSFEETVKAELEQVVRERVETLWAMGISGADLVIACVGAGLRAFTRFARVEYANGEEVPAKRFLTEVETVVLENILARLSKEVGAKGGQTSLAGMDAATRFYVLWRYTYGAADLDAGEAIIFANGTHVELDGAKGLSTDPSPLLEKKRSAYRLRDFTERGQDDKLGLPTHDGAAAPLVDALQRTLWLMENRPADLPGFLADARPNREQMRLVAQALAGPVLKGGELAALSPSSELAALAKLTANWRALIEDAELTAQQREARRDGQLGLGFEEGSR